MNEWMNESDEKFLRGKGFFNLGEVKTPFDELGTS